MKYIILIVFGLFLQQIKAQDFKESRITPIEQANSKFYNRYFTTSVNTLNCPPKLAKNNHPTFAFLDSIPQLLENEKKFLIAITDENCNSFYQISQSYQYANPFYQKALSRKGLSKKYSLLPLTMSANTPNLKYLGDKAGAWQLSFVTARKYGLEINQWFDERNNLEASSTAASAYLAFLTDYYLNNEVLIITAFYTSIPYVNKTISNLDTVNTINFYNTLTPEIQGYFSYLKAWSNWLDNFDVSEIQSTPKTHTEVFSNDTLSFQVISEFMDIQITELHRLNPIFVGETVIPNSNHSFYLPKEKAAIFNSKYEEFLTFQKEEQERKAKELAELKKRMESGIPDLTKHQALTYTVRSGDVLGKIAAKNNVKVSQIKQWNNLHSDRINLGQKLVLYVPKGTKTTLPKEMSNNKISTQPTKAQPGVGTPEVYTVKNGESLWLIAKKFPGVSAENIMEWNGCTEKISPGMTLKIYKP